MVESTVNKSEKCITLIFILCHSIVTAAELFVPEYLVPCDNNIYCYGDMLKAIQLGHIFTDDKTFVDMPMRYDPIQVWDNFNQTLQASGGIPDFKTLRSFVESNFFPAGSDTETWTPNDWQLEPKFLESINDSALREFGKNVNAIWKELGLEIINNVSVNPERFSILYVPNPFIVPGDRFREFYYWDTFWIMRGLLVSGMVNTVKGMLRNYFHIIKEYGFIPNGGRVYYTRRTQPPYLVQMMKSYLAATNDTQLLQDNFDILEQEFNFFMTNRTTQVTLAGAEYQVARYFSSTSGPRPESYSEDYTLVENSTLDDKILAYVNLKSAAESGMDFSTRWFDPDATEDNLLYLRTKDIIPVDLNALLCANARQLSEWSEQLGYSEKAKIYQDISDRFLSAIESVLWNSTLGAWFDFYLPTSSQRTSFRPTNVVPLWLGCYDKSRTEEITLQVLHYLVESQGLSYPGGIPTSLVESGEQWDFPNAWPPLQFHVIMALQESGVEPAQKLAFRLAQRWIDSNYLAYQTYNAMYEKYNCTVFGLPGGGGEYRVQTGFGWTNGVVLEFLSRWGNDLVATPTNKTKRSLIQKYLSPRH